jgi:catechol 2,3-dioxygenase-like lactoylglutathione lyase family enzyme
MSELIDHVGLRASDLAASQRMYEAALAELGFTVLGEGAFEGDAYVLFGRGTSDDFALHAVGTEPGRNRVTTGAHIAFRAPNASAVERWHAAAVRTGGTDNGAPGVRPEYSGRYYAGVRARSGPQQRRSRVPRTCRGRVVVNHQRVQVVRPP